MYAVPIFKNKYYYYSLKIIVFIPPPPPKKKGYILGAHLETTVDDRLFYNHMQYYNTLTIDL